MKAAPAHLQLALHFTWVLFSALAIALFYKLARAHQSPRPLAWTAIFCLGPAFIPSQNLMLDVPLLAVWLAFFCALAERDDGGGLLAAAALAAVACLIKYSSLVLLPILALEIVRRRRLAALGLLLVPIGALAGWSLFNWFDYGGIHLGTHPIATGAAPGLARRLAVMISRAVLWLVALGALTPFTPAFAGPLGTSRGGRRLLVAVSAIAVFASAIGRAALPTEPVVQSVLRGLFLGNGFLVAGLAVRAWRGAGAGRAPGGPAVADAPGDRPPVAWSLGGWVIASALFIIVLSPFIAVRHVLMALPAVLLIIARGPDALQLSRRGWALACGLTAVVGVVLAAADARLADLHRRTMPELAAKFCPASVRCVAIGHWGWQWYATQAGLPIYDRARTDLRAGDRLLVSELVGKEAISPRDDARLRLVARIEEPATPLTWARTVTTEKSGAQGARAGGFYYFWTSVPWTITTRPLDRFLVYEVGPP